MQKVAVLTMDGLENFECYDHLTYPYFRENGWQPVEVSWRDQGVDWDEYEAVLIRSPWDYQDDARQFITQLQYIESSRAQLFNPLSIVQWNIDKRYLAELQQKGVGIVPTLWQDGWQSDDHDWFAHLGSEEIVIKPCISANADNTFRLTPQRFLQEKDQLKQIFAKRHFMVQPFMNNIVNEGEYSLFYFNGELSHAILKTPKSGDFRVQEEHGGRLTKIDPENTLIESGDKTLAAIGESLLYARLDFVRHDNDFLLMEAELIEPSLYFNMDAASPGRFVEAFLQKIKQT